jgi:hypothetical protein
MFARRLKPPLYDPSQRAASASEANPNLNTNREARTEKFERHGP